VRVLYGTQRLNEIIIEQDTTGSGNWNAIRRFDFTYSSSAINQIYPEYIWGAGGLTLTLTGVQEKNGAGSKSLPMTSFSYEDDMHITKVENGYGGNVSMAYERWTYFDDVNDDLRSLLTIFGNHECTDSIGTAWTSQSPGYGVVGCNTSLDRLQVGLDPNPARGARTIPEHIMHLGGRYRFYVKAKAYQGSTDMNWGFRNADTGETKYLYSDDYMPSISTSYTELEGALEMPVDFDPLATKLLIECNDCIVEKIQFALQPLAFRVTTQTTTDTFTSNSAATQYRYDNPAPNDAIRSNAVDQAGSQVSSLYVYPIREFRGHAMAQTLDEDNLATTTWFYQDDDHKGRAYRTLVMEQANWDDFESFDTDFWTKSSAGTIKIDGDSGEYDDALKAKNTAANWDVYVNQNTYSLSDSNVAVAHVRLSDSTAKGEIGLESNAGQFFGVVIQPESGQHVARLRYDTGSGIQDGSILISSGNFELDSWYGVMLFVDQNDGFVARIWQLDDPTVAGGATHSGFSTASWRFRERIYDGTLWLDAYHDGFLFSETVTLYSTHTFYDTDDSNSIPDLSASGLMGFIDLAVVWKYATTTETRTYEGDAKWVGGQTRYAYDSYGNVTELIQAAWDDTNDEWNDTRQTKHNYVSFTSNDKYLVGLLGRMRQFECDSQDCTTPTNNELVSEVWTLYDDNSAYDTTPSEDKLTGQRTFVCFSANNCNNTSASESSYQFSDVKYGYDSYGNGSVKNIVYLAPS
jgi:hypothetical protein